jgi:hypothetical protein
LITNGQQCVNGQTYSLSPAGPYQPGDVVEVTYELNYFNQINSNWLIAFQINLGNGWEGLTPLTYPINSGQSGNWIWDNQNTFPSGLNFGPGWRFVTNVYNPNYGINSNGPFSMSFQITVSETCNSDDLSIGVEVYGDCLTGGWNAGNCCDDPEFSIYSGVVDVQADVPSAGTSNSIILCPASEPINLFNELGGSPDLNGVWNPALTNGYLGGFDPENNLIGAYSYTVSNECGMSSASVNINFTQPIISNTNEVEICSNGVSVDLYGEIGINNTSGQWSGVGPLFDSPAPDYLGLFNPQEQLEGVYNYSIYDALGCETIYPVSVDIISSQANSGDNAIIEICQDDQSISLFNQLNGNPDLGGIWSPSLSGNDSGIFNTSQNNEGDYVYTVSDQCGSESSTVQVNFFNVVSPNTTDVSICSNGVSVDLYGEIGINNTSGQWSGVGPLLDSPAPDYFGLFAPEEQLEGIYYYTIDDQNGCDQIYPVDVSIIYSQANAGIDGILEICQDDDVVNLFDFLSGNPDLNGNWSPSLNNGYLGQFDPENNLSGIYTYTINDECGSDNSEVEVSINIVNPPPILTD